MTRLITTGIDALLLNLLDPNALVGVTKAAKAANIPVFIIDSSIDPSAEYVTTIQSNNLANGALAREWLAKKFGKEKMNIALLAGNPVGRTRKQGLLQGIMEEQLRTLGYIDLNIKTQMYTNWSYAGRQKAMEDVLVAHPDVNVVITESDVYVLDAMTGMSKKFGIVSVLKEVNLKIKHGETHALLSENSADKSTLIKILNGVHQKDSGQVLLNGKEIKPRNTHEGQNLGVSVVY